MSYQPAAIPAISITATGTNQSNATVLLDVFAIINTSTVGSGVKIANILNRLQIICNNTVNPVNIYPISSMAIGNATVNTSIILQPNRSFGIIAISSTQAYIVFNSSSFY